jgi:hypothetical protein
MIGINESCTLRDDPSCESGLNEFTDHEIALLFEERYHIENVTIVHAGTCDEAPTNESQITQHHRFLWDASDRRSGASNAGADIASQSSHGTASTSCHTLYPPVSYACHDTYVFC